MKNLIVAVCILIVVGCGRSTDSAATTSAACAGGVLNGTYTGSILGNSDTMVLADSCAITSSYCASQSSVPKLTSASGTVTITVTATNARTGCLGLGDTNCAYVLSGSSLTFTCGAGVLTYTKQ